MTMPTVGDPAPPIALPDDTGTTHDLADQRGRWTVLYFYPKDDTPGCTVEACEFREANDTITERGADIWGVSPQGAASKRAFRDKFGLQFTLLSDEGHVAAEAYGAWVEKENYGKKYWGGRAVDVPRGSRGPGREGLAEGQARGPCGGGPRGARRAAGAGGRRRMNRAWTEASLVGGNERSLGRKRTPDVGCSQGGRARWAQEAVR